MKEMSPASPAVTGRLIAETMPLVTVPLRPNGDPIAIVASPTTTLSELPNAATGKFPRSTRSTAKSYEASVPTISALAWDWSWNVTVISGASPAPVTT